MTRQKKLRGLENITEFLKVVFASGFIDDKPLSCLLVAPVSSGKTTTIKQFKDNKNIVITTDSTAYGILKEYINPLKSREIRHFVIPDLLNALSRRKTTADMLILFINSTSEDGLFPSYTYGIQLNEYIEPFGWVLCLTSEAYKRKYKFLKDIGFISRFFVIEYKYSTEQINEILNDIVNEFSIKIPVEKIAGRKKAKTIKGNPEIFKELIPFSQLLCKDSDSEIIRMQKKLQVFLKSCAYLRGDNEVKQEDLTKLKELITLIK